MKFSMETLSCFTALCYRLTANQVSVLVHSKYFESFYAIALLVFEQGKMNIATRFKHLT